jgi:alpha-amylase/alpha-mannosidase (GH57 family)
MTNKCYLLFYLHMHQPFYKNLKTGRYLLPWARLHALRNYADIPALQEKYPGVKITYNLVPSLVEQILDYASGATDGFEEASLTPAEELTEDGKRFILADFFQLNRRAQIDPVLRLRQLMELKGGQSREVDERALRRFGPAELRDLQVLFNLAWSGWLIRERPKVKPLLRKVEGFTEEEKTALLQAQREHLVGVLEPYKRLMESGQSELSTSPYFHPILPLLCDTNSALEATPDIELPGERFRRPEDAAAQIGDGIALHERIIGRRPAGMWPSEGSLSEEACRQMASAGIRWSGSDRTVLARALGRSPADLKPADLFSPYYFEAGDGGQRLFLFFRDTGLSDLPAFVYYSWPAQKAADDFVGRLKKIADAADPARPPVVSVILDGENAWAAYPNNGREFFEALFERLQTLDWLHTVTPSEVLEMEEVEPRKLPRIVAGSWIYGTLTTWIGHPEKNEAWDALTAARGRLDEAERANPANEGLAAARLEMKIAEGSDWFWWYGDDHGTAYAAEFDTLFREHVSNVYHRLGEEPPPVLSEPIKKVSAETEIYLPLRLISPKMDGLVTNFQEWVNAGSYHARGGAGMQHQTSSLIEWVYFGFDTKNLYFRFDGREPFDKKSLDEYSLRVYITAPIKAEITFRLDGAQEPVFEINGEKKGPLAYGFKKVLEITVPLAFLGAAGNIAFYAALESEGNLLERHPESRVIEVRLQGPDLDGITWTA